ncbi:MAG: hypothetical protein GY702_23320, partial [Desulfobulbaceae bacterium]|nr:hypothetical protein [Desulfobulbaceae bacterium]
MKKSVSKTVVAMAVTMILTSHFLCIPAKAQNQSPRRDKEEVRQQQLATKGQIAQVHAILVQFNQSSLTADNAKAINRAFRDAGLRGGPVLNDAIRAAGWDPEQLRSLDPPPNRSQAGPRQRNNRTKPTGTQRNYSVEQAISDRAQLHTIAFNGLAFFTGDLCSDTFIPPGK